MNNKPNDQPGSVEWLQRMAELEDSCGAVSVGGLADSLGLPQAPRDAVVVTSAAFGKLIELARRGAGLGIEEIARQADLDIYELILLERGSGPSPEPHTVRQLCLVLGLPLGGVLALAGLAEPKDSRVAEAAARFAVRSESSEALSVAERMALQEFLEALVRAAEPK